MTAYLHVKAVLEHLEGDPVLAGNIIDGSNGDAGELPPPYVVVFSDTGAPEHERQALVKANRRDFTYDIHAVGVDANQARAWADRIVARLEGFRAVVPGWRPAAVKHVGSTPVTPENDLSVPMIYASNEFLQTSRRSG